MERDGESRHQKKRPSVQGCRVGWRRSLLLPTGVSVICIIARRKTYSQTLFIWGISQLQGNPKMHRICIFWDVLQTQASLQAGGSDTTPALFWDINTPRSQPRLSRPTSTFSPSSWHNARRLRAPQRLQHRLVPTSCPSAEAC